MAAPAIDGTWIAVNEEARRHEAATHELARMHPETAAARELARFLAETAPRFATGSVAAAPKLWFLFQQQGPAVAGTFRDEKTFTCELKGALAGPKLTFSFETVFSWLNVHDSGSAELLLTQDGAALAGRFTSGNTSNAWRLMREAPPSHRQPVAPPPPVTPMPMPTRSPPSTRMPDPAPFSDYPSRITKEVWDAERDPALMERLKARAEVEPELREKLVRRGHLPPDPS